MQYADNSRSLFSALRSNHAVAKVTGYTSALRVHRLAADNDRIGSFYAAPDAPAWPRLSPAADVFAFGVIMWELMSGILVYQKPCAALSFWPALFCCCSSLFCRCTGSTHPVTEISFRF